MTRCWIRLPRSPRPVVAGWRRLPQMCRPTRPGVLRAGGPAVDRSLRHRCLIRRCCGAAFENRLQRPRPVDQQRPLASTGSTRRAESVTACTGTLTAEGSQLRLPRCPPASCPRDQGRSWHIAGRGDPSPPASSQLTSLPSRKRLGGLATGYRALGGEFPPPQADFQQTVSRDQAKVSAIRWSAPLFSHPRTYPATIPEGPVRHQPDAKL